MTNRIFNSLALTISQSKKRRKHWTWPEYLFITTFSISFLFIISLFQRWLRTFPFCFLCTNSSVLFARSTEYMRHINKSHSIIAVDGMYGSDYNNFVYDRMEKKFETDSWIKCHINCVHTVHSNHMKFTLCINSILLYHFQFQRTIYFVVVVAAFSIYFISFSFTRSGQLCWNTFLNTVVAETETFEINWINKQKKFCVEIEKIKKNKNYCRLKHINDWMCVTLTCTRAHTHDHAKYNSYTYWNIHACTSRG